jgi:hypothetical protein
MTESQKEYEAFIEYRKRCRAIDTIIKCAKNINEIMPEEVTIFIKKDNLDWLNSLHKDAIAHGGYINMDAFKEYCSDGNNPT